MNSFRDTKKLNKNRTAIYSRVSTSLQKSDLQIADLYSYAERAGLKIIEEYSDNATSGRKESRPQLNKLMQAARNLEFDCILVWKFDRFARSVSHLLKALEEFHYLNIRFISVRDQVDTESPMGKAMFTIIGVMAELESSLISERVKAGMAVAKTKGKKLGRPKTATILIDEIEELAGITKLSINMIKKEIGGKASRAVIGKIVQKIRK